MKIQHLSFVDLGLCNYGLALQKQKELLEKRAIDAIPDTLILVEHSPVFTMGKHGKLENLLISDRVLREKNVELYRIERGGDITFHGPGQLIGYPIFKINQSLVGIRQFIFEIEKVLCNTLKSLDIQARSNHPYIGVWVENRKIASIGIAVKNHVTFHGFALNISTDLSYFDLINPCGLKNIKMTSIEKELNKKIPIQSVKDCIKKEFLKVLLKIK